MTDFNKGVALGLVLAYFLAAPLAVVFGRFMMWVVLITAGDLAFIKK